MSDDAKAPKKKAGKGRVIILALAAFLMGGAGVGGGLYALGMFDSAPKGPPVDPNKPRLVKSGENPVTVAQKAVGGSGGGEGGDKEVVIPRIESDIGPPHGGVDLARPADIAGYQATYFQMPAPYTSNLADSTALVQIALAISTYYDARVIQAVKEHETAIRSAILMLLSQENEAVIATPEGKRDLQKKLTALINRILKEKTGYSGIDNVYFTNFVIQ